jgi:biotin operon repressor
MPVTLERDEFLNKGSATQYAIRRMVASLGTLLEPRTSYGIVMDTSHRSFALTLRRIQSNSALSWNEVARTLGVSRRTVYNWLGESKVNGVNAGRVAGLYRALTQELTGVPRDQARSHLLAPSSDGVTPLVRITRDLRTQYPRRKPVLSGFDLLQTAESSDETMISGGVDDSMRVVDWSSVSKANGDS